MENFGTRLAECRRNKNFTQEEMANRLGVTPQALSKWEKGLSSPDISMVCILHLMKEARVHKVNSISTAARLIIVLFSVKEQHRSFFLMAAG